MGAYRMPTLGHSCNRSARVNNPAARRAARRASPERTPASLSPTLSTPAHLDRRVLGTSSTDGHGHFRFEKSGEGLFDDSDYDLMSISLPLPGGLAHPVRALREAQLHLERTPRGSP